MESRGAPGERWRQRVLDRLFSLQREGESDADFARRLGLKPQHLSNYRNGRHGLSLKSAVRISRATDLSLDWLLLGRGEPYGGGERRRGEEKRAALEELETLSDSLLQRVEALEDEGDVEPARARRFRDSLEDLVQPLVS